MRDDLTKRLRGLVWSGNTPKEAADRIEQLERELEVAVWYRVAWDQALLQRNEAEAKLTKAMEALQRIARSQPRPNKKGCYTPHDISSLQRAARTALAELEK